MRVGLVAISIGFGVALLGPAARAADEAPIAVPAPVPATPPSAAQPPAAAPPAASEPKAAGDQKAPAGDPAGVGGSGWAAEVAPSDKTGITLDEKQTEIVKKVSAYFNLLGDLKGAFIQTAGDKPMKGKFFMKRPGKFRFDYALPSKQIIISDGEYLAIQDLDLNNEDRVALDQTPFRLLLRKDVDLVRDAKISEVQEAEDMIVLALIDKDPDTTGKIKLFFSTKPELELKEWVTTDAQGVNTRVEVSQLVKGEAVDVSMFKIEPVNFNKFHP